MSNEIQRFTLYVYREAADMEPDESGEWVRYGDVADLLSRTPSPDVEGWKRGRWWRVLTPEGKLWSETSDEQEARDIAAEKGWPLEHLWVNTREEWRTEPALPDPPKGDE